MIFTTFATASGDGDDKINSHQLASTRAGGRTFSFISQTPRSSRPRARSSGGSRRRFGRVLATLRLVPLVLNVGFVISRRRGLLCLQRLDVGLLLVLFLLVLILVLFLLVLILVLLLLVLILVLLLVLILVLVHLVMILLAVLISLRFRLLAVRISLRFRLLDVRISLRFHLLDVRIRLSLHRGIAVHCAAAAAGLSPSRRERIRHRSRRIERPGRDGRRRVRGRSLRVFGAAVPVHIIADDS